MMTSGAWAVARRRRACTLQLEFTVWKRVEAACERFHTTSPWLHRTSLSQASRCKTAQSAAAMRPGARWPWKRSKGAFSIWRELASPPQSTGRWPSKVTRVLTRTRAPALSDATGTSFTTCRSPTRSDSSSMLKALTRETPGGRWRLSSSAEVSFPSGTLLGRLLQSTTTVPGRSSESGRLLWN